MSRRLTTEETHLALQFTIHFSILIMAQKTLRQFSAPSSSHIPTGLNINQAGNDGFELKTGLVNMVQASPFCGKASEDANAHL